MSNTFGASGKKLLADAGIQFPAVQVPDSDVNTLDDYEEGPFTPTVVFGGAAVGIGYNVQSGSYTKIGNRVFFEFEVFLSNKGSSSGAMSVSGLPFTANGISRACGVYVETMASITGQIMALVVGGTNRIDLFQVSSSTSANLTNGNATNTTALFISGHYTV